MSKTDFLLLKTILLSVAALIVVVVICLNAWQIAILNNTGRASPNMVLQNIAALGMACGIQLAFTILEPYVVRTENRDD